VAHVQATGVSLAYGDRDVLKDVTVNLSTGDRCALAGANGSGKSSLMKILAGISRPDSGTVTSTAGSRISYLPQSGVTHAGRTLIEEVELAYAEAGEIMEERDELAQRIAQLPPDHSDIDTLVHQHHEAEERILSSGYYDRGAEIGKVLDGLGFTPVDYDRPTEEFSGGWQMRIALAKVLLDRPDFLLLDEPTNYLDLEARVWLGRFLDGFPGGVLLVSHDRRFLDETVSAIWELFLADLHRYKGTYTGYEKQREGELAQRITLWERQQDEIQRLEDFIRKFRATASKAKQVQSRVKQLEKMVPIELPEYLKRIHFRIPPAPRSGREVVTMAGLSRAYGENRVLADLDLIIERGEKVVLVGPNGAGKSTLLRILGDQDAEYTGTRRYGAEVSLGYYAEDDNWFTSSGNDGNAMSVLEAVTHAAHGQTEQQLRTLLGGFLFHGDEVHKSMSILSGGERSRVALLEQMLRPVNLLVLDEPTNHLDMTSKEVLLEALSSYDGTIVFVSHDRSFIQSLAERVIELKPSGSIGVASRVTDYPGDYSYYEWKTTSEEVTGRSNLRQTIAGGTQADPSRDTDHEEHKRRRSRIQKLEKLLEEHLARIDDLQNRHREIQKDLTDPLIYGVGASVRRLTKEMAAIDEEIAEVTEQWESAEAELSRLLSD